MESNGEMWGLLVKGVKVVGGRWGWVEWVNGKLEVVCMGGEGKGDVRGRIKGGKVGV